MDSDSEEEREGVMEEDEDEEPILAVRARQGGPANRLPLHHFLRLIAGHGRMMEHGAAATNDDLVQSLKRGGVIQSDRVQRAMQLCPRDHFVPPAHRDEALIDAPIRVEAHDFNISAPHMHATCLEALALQPGHKFLDVGSGCGILTAAGAYLVGRGGMAVGFDVRRECIQMARDSVRQLVANSQEFAATACPVRFELQNVFTPAFKWLGQFDRVHVGASCPPDRLAPLVAMLRPEGGLIVVPVAPNDLRVITKRPNGTVTQKVISQVRFSDLEVPSEAEVLLATLRCERRQRTAPADHPSTFADDVAAIVAASPASTPLAAAGNGSTFAPSPMPTPCGSFSEVSGAFMPGSSPGSTGEGMPPTPQGGAGGGLRRLSKLFSSCSSGFGGSDHAMAEAGMAGPQPASPSAASASGGTAHAVRLNPEELGEPDCVLVGAGWTIPVHRSVLRQRCDHFRARCDRGWADSSTDRVAVPDHFSREAVDAFLHYCYHDSMQECVDPQEAVSVLHVALFYSCPRLVHLCELRLAQLLRAGGGSSGNGCERRGTRRNGNGKAPVAGEGVEVDEEGLADAAAALLAIADDNGLGHLRAVALDWIVHHYDAVAHTESYHNLSREQVALVAEEACRLHAAMIKHIQRMADQPPLPDPSY